MRCRLLPTADVPSQLNGDDLRRNPLLPIYHQQERDHRQRNLLKKSPVPEYADALKRRSMFALSLLNDILNLILAGAVPI